MPHLLDKSSVCNIGNGWAASASRKENTGRAFPTPHASSLSSPPIRSSLRWGYSHSLICSNRPRCVMPLFDMSSFSMQEHTFASFIARISSTAAALPIRLLARFSSLSSLKQRSKPSFRSCLHPLSPIELPGMHREFRRIRVVSRIALQMHVHVFSPSSVDRSFSLGIQWNTLTFFRMPPRKSSHRRSRTRGDV